MTPEERFTKIENLLQTLTENQIQQLVEIEKLQESQREFQKQSREFQGRTDQQIQALVISQQWMTDSLHRTADLQERTDARLFSLIETVDRLAEKIDRLADRPGH